MNAVEIDAAIERFRAAGERVGANLVEIERDQNRQLIEAASLTGQTAARRTEMRALLEELFDGFARIAALVERATDLRQTGPLDAARLAGLEALLVGASIDKSSTHLAISQRGLLDGSTKVERCTANELLASMTRSFESLKTVVFEIGSIWERLVPRIKTARDELTLAETTARGLGDEWEGELSALHRRLDEHAAAVASDPLSVTAVGVEDLERDIVAISGGIDRAQQLRVDLDNRLAAARQLVDHLDRATERCRELQRATEMRIASPSSTSRLTDDLDFGPDLDRILSLAHSQHWRAAESELTEWTKKLEKARQQIETVERSARSALSRRDELRGRLDAYNAKAAALGLIEDGQLSRIFDAAQRELFTAPTDLDRAEEIVRRYQLAIIEGEKRKVSM
jgi:hypothetical protein